MIVKLKKSARYRDLTFGPPYVVIGIEADEFRLLNDAGRPFWYEPSLFLVVDNHTPAEWFTEIGDDGERYSYPTSQSIRRFCTASLPSALWTLANLPKSQQLHVKGE